jgi:starch synthase (maltosyl-transferring)
MRASSRPIDFMASITTTFAPKIYYFHPLLAGPRRDWPLHLRRSRELGFDHILMAPPFAPGAGGDLFLTADHERAHPAIDEAQPADRVIEDFAQECRQHGLQLLLDLVLGRVAADGRLAQSAADWFDFPGSTGAPVDPRAPRRQADAAYARFDQPDAAKGLAGWWIERLEGWASAGVAGFRCEDPQFVPPNLWRHIIGASKRDHPDLRFLAWTVGMDWPSIGALAGVGFDAAFSSVAWWDGRAGWFVEEYNVLRGIGSVIGCPEALYGPRLAYVLGSARREPASFRHLLRRAAAASTGIMIPMGLEFASTIEMDRRRGTPDDLTGDGGNCKAGLAAEIRDANTLTEQLAGLAAGGAMRPLAAADRAVTALLRCGVPDQDGPAAVVLINTDLRHDQPLPITLDPLPPAAAMAASADDIVSAARERDAALAAGEIRVLAARASQPVKLPRPDKLAAGLAKLPRIIVDNVSPEVDSGRFAAKRVIGEAVTIEADVFTDGHDLLTVETLWRAADSDDWRRAPMLPLGNDRWRAGILPDRVGRYEFTVEAWFDRYGTFCRELDIKQKSGVDIGVEIMEGTALLQRAERQTEGDARKVLTSALHWLADASIEASVGIFMMPDVREVMAEVQERSFLYRRQPALALDVESSAGCRPSGRWASTCSI